MKTYPLKSISIEQAIQKQFQLVDALTQEFKGLELLNTGDLGIHPLANIPQTTRKVEKVIARFFGQEDSVFVRGAGTGAIREALSSVLKHGDAILVHDAPVYSTTITSLQQLGISMIHCDFNEDKSIVSTLKQNQSIKAVLIQTTRQTLNDSYNLEDLIERIREYSSVPIITDDNYAVMKIDKIGVECGADLSCFSCFKILGPEGIGLVVGKKELTDRIHAFHYSGGSQTQGFEALEALRGMVFAPVTHAVQAQETNKIVSLLNEGRVKGVEEALVANAQSKVVLLKLRKGIAKEVLKAAEKFGAAPYPIGAESKYEIAPMFYRLSGTMRRENPDFETHWIRINPMRAGHKTVIRILENAMEEVKKCF